MAHHPRPNPKFVVSATEADRERESNFFSASPENPEWQKTMGWFLIVGTFILALGMAFC